VHLVLEGKVERLRGKVADAVGKVPAPEWQNPLQQSHIACCIKVMLKKSSRLHQQHQKKEHFTAMKNTNKKINTAV